MGRILMILNKKFMYLVMLSITFSFPVVYFLIEELKKGNAKSTSLSAFNYGMAFLLIVILALLTVSWQSWKAATRNPVEALRYE
jgi:putative ABC transport system permease protein